MSSAEFRRFICRACGLVYDEAQGDADSGLAPGTRFEDIPDDWACPLCGVTKADFEPWDEQPVPQRAARPAWDGSTTRSANASGRRRHGVVIVGGGTAAWALAEQLRGLDETIPITLVSACTADRYDKPRLSVAFKQGAAPAVLVRETATAAAERLGVRLLPLTTAVGVETAARRLRTTRGTLRYDDLVLAHGAQARLCPGLPEDLTWRINDLGAYSRMRQALASCSTQGPARVAIVGAGLVGCELANDLALAGHPVVLIESGDRPLPMAAPAQSKSLLQAWEVLPIRFLGSARIAQARRTTNGGVALTLGTGQVEDADLLISAVGLATPTRLAEQAGLRWDNGIAVEAASLATGVPHVHALGDCISIDGRPQRFIEPIHRQARVVVARILGQPVPVYEPAMPPIRVKTSSYALTLAA